MDMKMIKDIEYRVCKELEDVFKKKDWGPPDYSVLHQLTGAVKNLKKIEEHEMGGGYGMNGSNGQNGYAQAGVWRASGNMEGEYGHNDGYANRHRDSMGRYARDDGYSQHGNNLTAMLEEKMRHARTDLERENIRRCKETIMNMM